MLILGIDCSSPVGAAGVMKNNNVLGEVNIRFGRRHSERLLPVVKYLFSELEDDIQELEGVAVTVGPGSFTGLRIGISTVKGFARALKIPLCGISTLDLFAYSIYFMEGYLVPVLDARRGRVYTALYRGGNRDIVSARLTEDRVLPVEELMDELARKYSGGNLYFVGNGIEVCRKYAENLKSEITFLSPVNCVPRGAAVAEVGTFYLNKEGETSSDKLLPRYLKKPQAEINYRRKNNDRGG